MTIKLIASDMDGTLLDSNQNLPKKNYEAVLKAINSDIIFTIATGRMYCSAEPFGTKLGINVPMITYNGALVKEVFSKEVVYECPLDKKLAVDVMKFAVERGVYAQTYVDDKLLVKKREYISDYYAKIANVEYYEVGNEIFNIKSNPHKVLLMTKQGDLEGNYKIKEDLKREFGNSINLTNSMVDFIEIMHPEVSKWNAVRMIADKYNIKSEEIMCIGDGNNDLDMVANAGFGVAMDNAFEGVKEAADFITKSNDENGVSIAIEKVLEDKR